MNLESIRRKKGKRWIVLNGLLSINLMLIFWMILLLEPNWAEMNYYVSNWVGIYVNLVLILLILLVIPIIYGIVLFFNNYKKLKLSEKLNPHKINKILPILFLLLYNLVSFLILIILGSYAKIILQKIEFYIIPIYLSILILLIILLYPFLKYIPNLKKVFSEKIINSGLKAKFTLFLILFLYIFNFIYPIIYIPANVIDGKLPSKPDIVAHRGGSQLGPENTLEVIEMSLDYKVVGWEVDIRISYDGVPFIMHDDDLKRTTNVEEKFPKKQDDRAESFKWKDLRELNAGEWYVDNDPYGIIASGLLSKKQIDSYEKAKIPSFEEVLNFTRENNLILDFDARDPPEDHPFFKEFREILFNMTIELIDDLDKIMIPTDSEDWLQLIKDNNAKEIWTYDDYDNIGDSYTNQQYREAYKDKFPIMVYTINSRERFSQLWCLGVTWVKTDAPQLFLDMDAPIWYIPLQGYVFIWITIYIGLGAMLISTRTKLLKN